MPTNEQDVQDQPLTERTIRSEDVYVIGFTGEKPTGTLTSLGEELKKQNPGLLTSLIEQAQGAAYQRCDALYPRCRAVPDVEVDQYRTDRTIGEQPAGKPAHAKPAAPQHDLHQLFGPTSDGGLANKIAKGNLPLYRQLREKAIAQGIVAAPARTAHRKVALPL